MAIPNFSLAALTRARMTPSSADVPDDRLNLVRRPWSSTSIQLRRLISRTPETAAAMITASIDLRPFASPNRRP